MKINVLILFIFLVFSFKAQEASLREWFIPVQYSGSIGAVSTGYGIRFPKQRMEGSVMYGYLFPKMGGPIHTVTFKFNYEPWKNYEFGRGFRWQQLQAGAFIAQHFGNNLSTFWDSRYPPGYYRWLRNTRMHLSIATGISYDYDGNILKRAGVYLETNTNDLYLMTWTANLRSVSMLDIFYLGVGTKLYF